MMYLESWIATLLRPRSESPTNSRILASPKVKTAPWDLNPFQPGVAAVCLARPRLLVRIVIEQDFRLSALTLWS